ncbi:MAG: hypothetical protein NTW17_01850 [Candidatus Pacearchaeota archaeon]|nr:hypothetical protein [Candidatus Pacearchaeota archaeon]
MVTSYYHIKPKKTPDVNGIVIRLDRGKLETFAGTSNPSKYGCSVDVQGNLVVDERYSFSQIDEKEALNRRENYENWILFQGWVAPDVGDPKGIFAITPGLESLAH